MALTNKDKKIIKQQIRTKSLSQLATQVGCTQKQIVDYLQKIWGIEKYQRVVSQKIGASDVQKVTHNNHLSIWKILKENYKILFALVACVWLLYGPFINNAFLSDDIPGIVNNPDIFNFSWVIESPLIIINRLNYFLISNIFGIHPWAFRIGNIVAHSASVVGVFVLTYKLINKYVAVVAGFLFATHPLMIEPVIWISGNGYAWYSSLLIWSFIFYLYSKNSWKKWLVSTLLFLVALQFSEKAAVFPGILVLYHLVVDRKRSKWWQLSPYIALAIIWLVVNLGLIGDRLSYLETEYNQEYSNPSLYSGPVTQVPIAIINYTKLIFWPDKLTLYHSELSYTKTSYAFMSIFTLLYFFTAISFCWQGFRGKQKSGLIGLLLIWPFIALSPTLLPLYISSVVAERYFYFSATGVFILLAWGGVALSQKQKLKEVAWMSISIILCLLMVRTLVRNNDWKDQDHLWLSAQRTSPSSSQNQNNLGDLYGRRGDLQQAEWHFKKAIEFNPTYADAMHNLANTYTQMGRLEDAIHWYNESLVHKPSLLQSQVNIELIEEYLEDNPQDQ